MSYRCGPIQNENERTSRDSCSQWPKMIVLDSFLASSPGTMGLLSILLKEDFPRCVPASWNKAWLTQVQCGPYKYICIFLLPKSVIIPASEMPLLCKTWSSSKYVCRQCLRYPVVRFAGDICAEYFATLRSLISWHPIQQVKTVKEDLQPFRESPWRESSELVHHKQQPRATLKRVPVPRRIFLLCSLGLR